MKYRVSLLETNENLQDIRLQTLACWFGFYFDFGFKEGIGKKKI